MDVPFLVDAELYPYLHSSELLTQGAAKGTSVHTHIIGGGGDST